MSRIIIILVLMNIISCAIVRRVYGGKMIIDLPSKTHIPQGKSTMIILLAGMLNQPREAFKNLPKVAEDSLKCNYVVFPKYSNLGWRSMRAAEQLDKIIREKMIDTVEICTISVGDKVARQIVSDKVEKIYAINPCPSPGVLNDDLQKKLPHLARLLEIVTFALGWIAILPLIPTDANRYSIALLADQLLEISVNEDFLVTRAYKTYLVLSKQDEFLNNIEILRYFGESESREPSTLLTERTKFIETKHGRTIDEARLYDAALRKLDREEPNVYREYVKKIMSEEQ